MDNSNRPDIRAYIGATGSGKGVSIRAHLDEEPLTRFLAWDPLGEYGKYGTTMTSLAGVAKALQAPSFRVAFNPGPNPKEFAPKFAMLCRIAFAAGKLKYLVEELADVTGPSFAPLEWRRCTTQGRHRGLRIVAASQRPAQIDKQFLGGCTYIRCFTLRYPADRQAMAGAMDVPLLDINSLSTVEGERKTVITYMEKDFRAGKTQRGTIELKAKK